MSAVYSIGREPEAFTRHDLSRFDLIQISQNTSCYLYEYIVAGFFILYFILKTAYFKYEI